MNELERELFQRFRGRIIKVSELYSELNATAEQMKEIKRALIFLEQKGYLTVDKSWERRIVFGKILLPDNRILRFSNYKPKDRFES